MTPQVNFQNFSLSQAALNNYANANFSPLNSPAMDPLDKYEEQFNHQTLVSAGTNDSSSGFISPPASYQMSGMNSQNSAPTPLALNPVTPALLMQLSQHAADQNYNTEPQQSRLDKKIGKRRFVSLQCNEIANSEPQNIIYDQPVSYSADVKNNYEQGEGFQKF
jgi:hypothetical protein